MLAVLDCIAQMSMGLAMNLWWLGTWPVSPRRPALSIRLAAFKAGCFFHRFEYRFLAPQRIRQYTAHRVDQASSRSFRRRNVPIETRVLFDRYSEISRA